ncbi:MAG: signal recognition particle-docking protein FtsY [Lachnospiraceae bacterium]|nr:signal recognition particle-docking protein FtsY [Lachnospiraceae bacterium]
MSFFDRLKSGLSRTRDNFANVFTANEITEGFYEELEETLIMGDVGMEATEVILEELRERVKSNHFKKCEDCRELLKDIIVHRMETPEDAYSFTERPSVLMFIGVNGVGKTTTVGKIAGKLKAKGKRTLIAAADTFRAAASEQLEVWAKRADVPIVSSEGGADPASVVFDAVSAAKARNVDVLLIDTAGRLHNKKNLMDELGKMNRIIEREYPDVLRENLLVLDGTTGQNAILQAREFNEVANLTGIVLTKMDGTAKGGIAIAIAQQLGVPVKYIGVGESIDDLERFDPVQYVEALFDRKESAEPVFMKDSDKEDTADE